METTTQPKGVAFFDFDKTILTVDSGPIYGLRIFRDGTAHTWPSLRAGMAGIGYKMGLIKRRSIARIGVGAYEGLSQEDIASWMKMAFKNLIQEHLSELILKRIREHQQAGFHTIVISASPPFFLRETAHFLGMDGVFGSDMLFEDGVCTGRYAGKYMDGEMKKQTAKGYAAQFGLDLQDCWFYSDHVADIKLLEAVGNPVAVGPEDKLRKIAGERNWLILEH